MWVNNGMAAAVTAMASIEASANSGKDGKIAATRNDVAPMKKRRDAALAGKSPRRVTTDTTTGVNNNPRLLPAATAAFHNAPELYARNAMVSRKVVPALSMIPELNARQRS